MKSRLGWEARTQGGKRPWKQREGAQGLGDGMWYEEGGMGPNDGAQRSPGLAGNGDYTEEMVGGWRLEALEMGFRGSLPSDRAGPRREGPVLWQALGLGG